MLRLVIVLALLFAPSVEAVGWPFRCTQCERDGRGKIKRSRAAANAFKRASGYPRGRPGYVIDHVIPLACAASAEEQHGLDAARNMQWQSTASAKAKDRWEMELCAPETRIATASAHRQWLPQEEK